MMQRFNKPALVALGLGALVGAAPLYAQMAGHGGGAAHHGADGTGHDEVTMPGLRGLDVTPEESAEMAVMFRNFPVIDRTVTLLPDGIRTETFTADDDVRGALISHVTGMLTRVEEGRDPKVLIQSPTLDILFERRDTITTEIDVTDTGIVVIQTSTDPEVVTALQVHADEVTDMANRGMQSVHERMMGKHH